MNYTYYYNTITSDFPYFERLLLNDALQIIERQGLQIKRVYFHKNLGAAPRTDYGIRA